jgi:transposase-like protein
MCDHSKLGNRKKNKFKNITICNYCNSKETIKKGFRKTENRGKVQKYFCKSCNKFFTLNDGFYRMRNHPQKITQALHLYFSGASLRKTQEYLGVFNNHNCSYVTILNWIRKYSNQISEFTDTLNLNVGQELMSDEMEYSTKGQQTWFVDVLDTKTRFIVSSEFMRSRTLENLTSVLRTAKRKTGNQIKIITTDGLKGYPRVLRKSFGLKKRNSKITHNIVIASERGFNHKIERLHGNIRERTKTFRGFGNLESAKAIMKGYVIYHNFVRKHQALNKYPYQLATNLKLGKNKWLDLIKISSGSSS